MNEEMEMGTTIPAVPEEEHEEVYEQEIPVGEGEMKTEPTFEERKNMIKSMLEQTTIECYKLLRAVPEIYENVSRATEDDFEAIDRHNMEIMQGLQLQVLHIG